MKTEKQSKTLAAPVATEATQETETVEAIETETETQEATPVTPATDAPKTAKVFAVDSPVILAARTALSVLLGPVAKLRNDAAKLNAAANESYKAVSPLEVAKLYATIASEVFTARPALRTAVRSWGSAWKYQMEMLALETFGATEGDKAVDLRSRFGVDASKYGLVFYYCPTVIPVWVQGLYGTQPESFPTLAQAYAIARNLKMLAAPKKDEALAKLWTATAKKLPTVAEMRRFADLVLRDVVAREQQSHEAKAPEVETPVAQVA